MFEAGERPGGADASPGAGASPGARQSLVAVWRDSVGPAALMVLAAEPLAGRGSAELLEMLAAWERQAAWLAGRQTELTAAIAAQVRAEYETARREAEARGIPVCFSDQTIENDIEAEVGTALRLAPSTANARVTTAEALASRLRATQTALSDGKISYWHAVTMVNQTAHLDDLDARVVEREVLPRAFRDTVGGLRRRLRNTCMVINPSDTSTRARQAKAERTVTLQPGEDGTAILQAIGPAPALQSVFDALDITAGRASVDDPRRIGARRFDALVDASVRTLDNAQCPGEPRVAANVYVTVDLTTLLGLRDNPAALHGYGPLPAPLARILARDNGWRRLIHDPITGAPKDLGRLRRFPSAELRDWIRVRDQVCVFPGCYRSAVRCAIDHRIDAGRGGATNKDNLAPLCPKHHRVKDAGWTYQLHSDRVVWTSPHRLSYTRYLPGVGKIISEDLALAGEMESRRQRSPDNFIDYMEVVVTGDQPPDCRTGPRQSLAADHPDYDGEPPDSGAFEFEPPESKLRELEPLDLGPSDLGPPDFGPPEFQRPEFQRPDSKRPDSKRPDSQRSESQRSESQRPAFQRPKSQPSECEPLEFDPPPQE